MRALCFFHSEPFFESLVALLLHLDLKQRRWILFLGTIQVWIMTGVQEHKTSMKQRWILSKSR